MLRDGRPVRRQNYLDRREAGSDLSEDWSYVVTDAVLLLLILAGPWLHAFTRGRSPSRLDALVLITALISLVWWGLPYGVGSAGCWMELLIDGSDKCPVVTDYMWVPVVILMVANIIVGAVP